MTSISIIICTKDRADSLRETLASIGRCKVPAGLPAELLVVDNGSSDRTREVVETAGLGNMPVRYIHEPRKGKGYAYNTGMAEANGGVFLFTDDDVRVPANWIEGMCRPIPNGMADAVAGGVELAPHLNRDGMDHVMSWLACTAEINATRPDRMVGANMAFARRVLEYVPAFDIELGPGALGFADETLFSMQLTEAGFRLGSAFDVHVEHHLPAERLRRKSLLDIAVRMGRSSAYLDYHWFHERRLKDSRTWLRRWAGFNARRVLLKHRRVAHQIAPAWELYYIVQKAYRKQYKKESCRPPNYERKGLVRKDHVAAAVV